MARLPEPRATSPGYPDPGTRAPSPGSGPSAGTPGAGTPSWADYLALIQNDPIYKQSVADENAASASDSAQLGSGVLSALVNRGLVPNIDSVASSLGLSPAVVNWIKGNVNLGNAQSLANQANASGVSEEAQLQQAHKTVLGNITDSLAARGMVRSGATPFLTGQEATRNTQARYQADKALADYISGAYSAFAKAEQGRGGDLRTALTDAYTRILANLGGAAPPGPLSTTSGSTPGSGLPGAPEPGGAVPMPSTSLLTGAPPEKVIGPTGDIVLHGMRPSRLGPAVRRSVVGRGQTSL